MTQIFFERRPMSANPLDQFLIKPLIPLSLGSWDITFTNSSLFMMLTTLGILLFQYCAIKKEEVLPSRLQSLFEITYDFIDTMVKDNLGDEGKKYFPFIFSLFLFLLAGNLWGMVPYAFTFTSHIIVTFSLAFAIFIGITLLGLSKHGLGFFRCLKCCPNQSPKYS